MRFRSTAIGIILQREDIRRCGISKKSVVRLRNPTGGNNHGSETHTPIRMSTGVCSMSDGIIDIRVCFGKSWDVNSFLCLQCEVNKCCEMKQTGSVEGEIDCSDCAGEYEMYGTEPICRRDKS